MIPLIDRLHLQNQGAISVVTIMQHQYMQRAKRDQVNMQKQVKAWLSREERMQAREAKQAIVIAEEGAHSVPELLSQINEQRQVHSNNSDNTNSKQCYFADWSNHTEGYIYYS